MSNYTFITEKNLLFNTPEHMAMNVSPSCPTTVFFAWNVKWHLNMVFWRLLDSHRSSETRCKTHGDFLLFVECDFLVASFRPPLSSPLAACTVGRLREVPVSSLWKFWKGRRGGCVGCGTFVLVPWAFIWSLGYLGGSCLHVPSSWLRPCV